MSNVARTILEQLGGREFILLTGAKNLVGGEMSLSMKIGKNPMKVTHVRIVLNGLDYYDVEFLRIHGTNIKTESLICNVDCESLKDVFETHTGLYVSLKPRKG